jgi:hypothetical protein
MATQNHYIKTVSPDAIAAMKQFSEALLCSTCDPDGDVIFQFAKTNHFARNQQGVPTPQLRSVRNHIRPAPSARAAAMS